MNNPKVFIIILNFKGYADTANCIKSLQKSTYSNYEIILIDNASTDDSPQLLLKTFPNIHFIQSKYNGGYAYGMNLGAKYAISQKADYILYLNNDTEVEPDFLERLLERMTNDNEIGIVSPKVLYMHDKSKIYCAGGKIDYLLCGGVAEFQGKPADSFGNDDRGLTLAEGCCLLIKKEVFEEIGYMNEKYFMYFEDVDFSYNVKKKFAIKYAHDSIVYHKSGAGKSWSEYSPLYYYYYTRNRLWFFADFSLLYRLYVIIFSFLNTAAKTLILEKNLIASGGKNERIKQSMKKLWKGFAEGLLLILKIREK
jgi:GT2 family glycosyltransferase